MDWVTGFSTAANLSEITSFAMSFQFGKRSIRPPSELIMFN